MGYSTAMFEEIGKLKFPSRNVLDIGAQDVSISSVSELDQLNHFIRTHNPCGDVLHVKNFPCFIEAREVYVKAGFNYTCIDVDERSDTLRVDLAKFEIPRPRGQFGLVVNVGTTEHLSSPAATFALMHEMCAVGGVLYNDVPLFGLGNHGLINPTPKFWHALIWMNAYATQSIRTRKIDELAMDRGNFFHDYLNYIEGLEEIKNISYIITVVLKKEKNNIFIIPYDAVFPDSDTGRSLATLLFGSYYPFLKVGAYTSDEVVTGINNFLRYNGRAFKVASLKDFDSAVGTIHIEGKDRLVWSRVLSIAKAVIPVWFKNGVRRLLL